MVLFRRVTVVFLIAAFAILAGMMFIRGIPSGNLKDGREPGEATGPGVSGEAGPVIDTLLDMHELAGLNSRFIIECVPDEDKLKGWTILCKMRTGDLKRAISIVQNGADEMTLNELKMLVERNLSREDITVLAEIIEKSLYK